MRREFRRVGRASARPTRRTSTPAQYNLQRAGLTRPGEHVIGVNELVKGEVVSNEPRGVDLLRGNEPEQRGGRAGVDQPGRDRYILDPQLLEMKGGGLAVHADVGDAPTR